MLEFYDQAADEADEPEQEERRAGYGRDIKEENLTQVVLETMKGARTKRAQKVLNAFTRHLHAFLDEVEPTEEEWEWGHRFHSPAPVTCRRAGRQEYVLLSDVMGATTRVDLVNHRFPDGATENSVLGPFFVENRPTFENGADISAGIDGKPMLFTARVLDLDGRQSPAPVSMSGIPMTMAPMTS